MSAQPPQRRTVTFVYWPRRREESVMALGAVDRAISVLPQAGDAYWHHLRAQRVVEVTEGDPPEIHVEPDEERDGAFYAALPEGSIIDAGRDGDTGRWHAEVYESDAARGAHRVAGWGIGGDCDSAVSEAIREANTALRSREQGD